jgi:hypothetical protein
MSSDLAWPRWVLPKPLQAGFVHQLLPAVARLDVEAGPPRQWQDQPSDYRVLSATLSRMSAAQQLALADFYHRTTQQGTLPFDVQFEDGRPDDWWQARFLEPPQQSWSNGYRINAVLRLLLIGEPFAARATPSLAAMFDTALLLRATGTATFAIGATFDAQVQLRATAVDTSIALAVTFDTQFRLRANGQLNPDDDLGATFDAQVQMRAVRTSSEARQTDDADDRFTDDGSTRVTD